MQERLQKYMAECGVASRRKCEEYILAKRVKVNNDVIENLGIKVDSQNDTVCFDGKIIEPESIKIYIALNKPEGYLSSVSDNRGRKTIIDLVKVSQRIYPVGRLDYDTSGLIILTNDGSIYNNIIHPREEKNKVYIAIIKGIPTIGDVNKFCSGIDIGGYITSNAEFSILGKIDGNCKAKITIHEGKNRQIRKMCSAIDHPVISLMRISVGKINLGDLKLGKWRELTEDEVNYLKNE